MALIGLTLNACATRQYPTDQYAELDVRNSREFGALLNKLAGQHQQDQGNPITGGPARPIARTCSSFPIFGLHGEFVRYHVECR